MGRSTDGTPLGYPVVYERVRLNLVFEHDYLAVMGGIFLLFVLLLVGVRLSASPTKFLVRIGRNTSAE
jgi:hypothetical protein